MHKIKRQLTALEASNVTSEAHHFELKSEGAQIDKVIIDAYNGLFLSQLLIHQSITIILALFHLHI